MNLSAILDEIVNFGVQVKSKELLTVAMKASSVSFLVGIFVTLFGFREKMRTRFNYPGHCDLWCLAAAKALLKAAVTLQVVLNSVAVLVLLCASEGILITSFTFKVACDMSENAFQSILDLLDGHFELDDEKHPFDESCESIGKLFSLSTALFIGSAFAVLGNLIILAYWFK